MAGADLLQHVVARLVQPGPHPPGRLIKDEDDTDGITIIVPINCEDDLRVAVPVNSGSVDQVFLPPLAYA